MNNIIKQSNNYIQIPNNSFTNNKNSISHKPQKIQIQNNIPKNQPINSKAFGNLLNINQYLHMENSKKFEDHKSG